MTAYKAKLGTLLRKNKTGQELMLQQDISFAHCQLIVLKKPLVKELVYIQNPWRGLHARIHGAL